MIRPLLIANFAEVVGGGEVSLIELAKGLCDRGYAPIIATPGPGALAHGFDRRILPTSIFGASRKLKKLACEADLIHTTGARGLMAAWLARSGKPLIWHARVAGRDKLDWLLARLPDRIIANSAATATRFRGRENVIVVPNGVALPPRPAAPLSLAPDRKKIAVIARMTPEKGHMDLCPAVRGVLETRTDVEWVFIGDATGSIGRTVREAAHAYGDRVRLLGVVPNAAAHLPEFDLVVVPSRIEGFGRVAAEALRAGVPVLATRIGGLVEVLEGHPDPWLPDSNADWAARILKELDAPSVRPDDLRRLGARFDPASHVEAMLAVYRELLR
jgi:glycosyltransferase involved in cell wall biosynthesis